jgi:opacity protein-like surface antigen
VWNAPVENSREKAEKIKMSRMREMKALRSKAAAVILCLLLFAAASFAASDGRSLDRGTNELGFWAGYSPDNPALIGVTTNRPFFEFNLQYARVLVARRNWALKYTFEMVPVAIISQPRQVNVAQGTRLVQVDAATSPIGLQVNFRRHRALQPYIEGTAGVLYFTDQVPVSGSSQFNFGVGWGAGVQLWHRENQSVSLGYKFHHISNANSANRNPGADSNLLYAGYSWSWKH